VAIVDAALKNVRAVVTTRWSNTRYTPRIIRAIEGYYVDSAIDTDADSWNLEFGDVDEEMMRLFNRDSEIRVQLFGVGSGEGQKGYMMTGIADDVSTDETSTIRMVGRDMSSLATDSTVPPQHFKHRLAADLIKKQATEIGIPGPFHLVSKGSVRKILRTDGSESFWEFWYRLARNEKMWLWASPVGGLNMSPLNYGAPISYTFGQPDDPKGKGIFIPVETIEIRKNSASRIFRVETYGHFGIRTFKIVEEDPSIRDWMRKPLRILYDANVTTKKGASKLAKEEIFEQKVGAVELTVTTGDPGYLIQTNKIAAVELPTIGISGVFYIVGVRRNAGPDGFVQEIRLREKNYAISRRVPEEPRPGSDTSPGGPTVGKLPNNMAVQDIRWAECFIKAAEKWRGPWNFSLYLAVLLGICHIESTFKNVRSRNTIQGQPNEPHDLEWYPWHATWDEANRTSPSVDKEGRTYNQWKLAFANEAGQWADGDSAVGPMQLLSQSFKDSADALFGRKGQFDGGRWDPCTNIMLGAEVLRGKLKGSVGDTGRDADIWEGVWRYNGERGYAALVKKAVEVTPGYLAIVKEAILKTAHQDDATDAVTGEEEAPPAGGLTEIQATALMRMPEPPGGYSEIQTRQRICAAAMIGYYNQDQIFYDMGARRDDDAKPYPNIPNPIDCSGYASWCYRSAGDTHFTPQDWTGSMEPRGTRVSIDQAQPGDLVFYPNHVTIYIGNGKCVSMGEDSGPNILAWNYRSTTSIRSYL
jgi:prophage tail gpP-like protein